MAKALIGYARCSTDKQDLAAQRAALIDLGVAPNRIYVDHGLTGTSRSRPGLDQALAAVRSGDTLVVPKLDRLARSVPDARQIADSLAARGVTLALGKNRYNPADPMGRMFFNILATFAEFEADLIQAAHARRHGDRSRKRAAPRQAAEAIGQATEGTVPHARHEQIFDQRPGRAVLDFSANGLSHSRSCRAEARHTALKKPRHLSLKVTSRINGLRSAEAGRVQLGQRGAPLPGLDCRSVVCAPGARSRRLRRARRLRDR